MNGKLAQDRRDPAIMREAYNEAKRRNPKAKEAELLTMAKVIYTEEWKK